jgi:Tol biopolymer transport system component
MNKNLIIVFVSIQAFAYAQLPDTDIWLLDINKEKDSIWLSNPQNVTDRKGYDNQPAFSPDGKYILYTSIRDEKQSDIYKYDLATKQITQITNTATSEYSPTFMPDGKNISVVMMEPDSTQRLWKFPIQGGVSSCIAENIDSVGYHCWVSSNVFAYCKITNPMSLYIYDFKNSKLTHVSDSVGRSIHFSYNRLFFSRLETIYSYHKENKKSQAVKIKNSEDFNFLAPNRLIMANESKIFSKSFVEIGKDGLWKPLLNLDSVGVKNITRIAISPDGKKIAIVATHN